MISYKINMKLSGRMTQLPDSQKIFGALIYFYAEKTSEKQAEEFVSGVKEGRIFFYIIQYDACGIFTGSTGLSDGYA